MPLLSFNSTTRLIKPVGQRCGVYLLLLLFITLGCNHNPASSTGYAEVILIPENGAISPVGAITVPVGSVITPTVIPFDGNPFAAWKVTPNIEPVGSSDNPTSAFRIKGNGTITATFRSTNYFPIDIVPPPNATITKSPEKLFYQKGDVVTFTFNPPVGYRLSSWTGGTSGSVNPTTVTITGPTTISATMGEIPGVAGVVYVCKTATGSGNGTNWANAYTELYSALIAAITDGAKIWVASGVYTPLANGYFRTYADNVKIYGGFTGNETSESNRNLSAHFTELDGASAGVSLFSVLNNGFYISGFVIRNARTTGLKITKSNCIVEDCIFKNNGGAPNTTGGVGLSIEEPNGDPVVSNIIQRCVFHSNSALAQNSNGRALHMTSVVSATQIKNCIFVNNTNGPAIRDNNLLNTSTNDLNTFDNCTIYGNNSNNNDPGGLFNAGKTRIRGSIFWANQSNATTGTQINTTYIVDDCDIQNALSGGIGQRDLNNWYSGNIDQNPSFNSTAIPATDGMWFGSGGGPYFVIGFDDGVSFSGIPTPDLRGRSRGNPAEFGAYER